METLVLFITVAGLLFLAVVFVLGGYNKLVKLRNRYRNAFAQIDVQLKRRYDLIPNLVATAKGYMQHERETLEAVTLARSNAVSASQAAAAQPGDPAAMKQLGGAETALMGMLGRLMIRVEAYPQLKADQTMARLMEELTSTENKVAFARQAYNDAVMFYNTKRETVPTNVIAGLFGFEPAELFVVESPEERHAPQVSF
jgi:LemA protein